VEDCAANGIAYAGIAALLEEDRETLDDYKRFAEKANEYGEKSKAAGVQLYYHNHNFEFEPVEGTTPYAEMIKLFDEDLVKLELDVFWATVAGEDPLHWLKETADRMLFLHLKDLRKGFTQYQYSWDIPEDSFTELGEGMLDLRSILAEAKKAGIIYAILDQDHTRMEDKIASVQKNCDFIRELGI
jgi:sugar phosphate isomerase/epimerase